MGKGVVKARIGKKDVVIGDQVPPSGAPAPAGTSNVVGTAAYASSTSLGAPGSTSAKASGWNPPAPSIPVSYQPRQRMNNGNPSLSPAPIAPGTNAGGPPPPPYGQNAAGNRPAPPPLPPRDAKPKAS